MMIELTKPLRLYRREGSRITPAENLEEGTQVSLGKEEVDSYIQIFRQGDEGFLLQADLSEAYTKAE